MENALMKKKRHIAYFNLALCILLWAAIPVVTKKILVELDNLQTLFYSTIFSCLVMGVLMVIQNKIQELNKNSRKEYLTMACLGFLGNYLYYVLLYGALERTTASEGFVLAYTWPMLVLVLSFIILKEKVTAKKLIGVLISFSGIIIITTKGNIAGLSLTSLSGDLLAVCGALVFALFSVLGKKHNFDNTISVFVYFLSALIFLFPTVAAFSSFVIPSFRTWLWLLLNGVLINGVTYVFWFKALEDGETHIISNLLYLTPFISLIYIAIFLREKILLSSFIGLSVIVLGVLLQYVRLEPVLKRKQC